MFVLLSLDSGWAAAAEDSAPTLTVSGSASFLTETKLVGSGFEVRASLGDEVGRPLTGAEIRVRATGMEGTASLRRCGDSRREGPGELLLNTDASGRVCVEVAGMPSGSLDFSFDDRRGYFARTIKSVKLPESATDIYEVAFDPPISSLSLDQAQQNIGVLARARGYVPPMEPAELSLFLSADGAERELTRVALDGFGEIHQLSLASASFGQPGPARLIARLRTGGGRERAQASTAVLRTATVALRASSELATGVEPGASIQLRAASVLGPAPSGVIEARSAGRSVAAARVQEGAATLTLPDAPSALLGGTLSIEYVGQGPGWLPGPTLEVRVLPPGRGYGRYALWIAAAALAALAVVAGWRRPPRARPHLSAPPPRSRASVEVLEAFAEGGGYRGLVRDAHDGSLISPAAITFVHPGNAGRVLLQVSARPDGSFSVESNAFPSGTLVEVTAPFHATLTAPLPGPGVLELSLISRRRALLDRLVRWAERHGKPWIRPSGEPTPAHIAAAANGESEPHVARWAEAVEHLAFGPNPPDAGTEQAAGVLEDPKLGRD